MAIGGIRYKEEKGMIKCYNARGEKLEGTIDEILGHGAMLILETDEDYKKLKSMIKKSHKDFYKSVCDKIYSCGRYKYFWNYDKFLKEFSYEDACDILKLCKDKEIVCYTEDDKYYVGVFDR